MGRHENSPLKHTDTSDFDFEKVLEKDEQETRYDQVIKHRKKVKLRRRRLKILIVLLFIGAICVYMLTSLSNIKILQVNDNVVFTSKQILDKAGLKYNGKMIFHPTYFIENALKEDDLIKDVKVKKDYVSGAIYIQVQEEKVIGQYQEANKTYVLLANGEHVLMQSSDISLISSPFIHDLSETQRKELAKQLASSKLEDIALISEIKPYATSYDKNMLELLMQDGRIVRTSYHDLSLLEYYRDILQDVNSNNRCLYFMTSSDSKSIQPSSCGE